MSTSRSKRWRNNDLQAARSQRNNHLDFARVRAVCYGRFDGSRKMNGKAYANRKPVSERPQSDDYPTPIALGLELVNLGILNKKKLISEPAAGNGQLAKVLRSEGYAVISNDIQHGGYDFLQSNYSISQIVTNPPFSLFDDFVMKAKELSPFVVMIGKTNFFAAQSRYKNGVWKHLKHVYIFSRQIDYRTPLGSLEMNVGNLVTGWFVWDRRWNKSYWNTSIIDVQKYCTLGAVKE